MNVYTTLVDDAFVQADGPLESVNWTVATAAGVVPAQVTAHVVHPLNVIDDSIELYTGASGWIVGRQFIEVAVPSMFGDTADNNFLSVFLFSDVAVNKGLAASLQPSPTTPGNVLVTIFTYEDVQVGTGVDLPFVPGAHYRVEAFDGTITHFYNGVQIGQYTAPAPYATASGIPGFEVGVIDLVTNVQMSRFTAGIIAPGPPPAPPTSIREQIFVAAAALLEGTGAPAGLTVTRERLRPIEKESLPAMLLYATDDPGKPLAGQAYQAPLWECQLNLVVECRANCETGPPDTALDPLTIWAQKTLLANEKFGGLANGIEQMRTTWNSREGEIAVAACAIHFTVKYRTARADPTKKDPLS